MYVAHHESDRGFELFAGGITGLRDTLKAEDPEMPPAGGEIGVRDLGEA